MLLVQDEQVIETLPTYAPKETFTARIGARSVERCPQEFDPGPARHPCEERTELAVVIPNQEPGCLANGRGLPQLLGEPGIGRMASHPDRHDFSALQFDDEEGKQRVEEEVGDLQEVASPNLMRMVVQEGAPGLGIRMCASTSH